MIYNIKVNAGQFFAIKLHTSQNSDQNHNKLFVLYANKKLIIKQQLTKIFHQIIVIYKRYLIFYFIY